MQRIAVVTGRSSGIGKTTANRLLDAGFTVFGLARHHDQYSMKHARYHPRSWRRIILHNKYFKDTCNICDDPRVTTLIIKNRVPTIELCDEVVFLENGKVKAQGKHHDLMKSVDTYKSLFLENQTSEI